LHPNFPPPNRAHTSQSTNHGFGASGAYQPPPSAGAQKYASYVRAGPPKWDKPHDDARTRADAYRAFQGLKPNVNATGAWTRIDPHTGRPVHQGGKGDKFPAPNPPTPRPQSAYEPFSAPPKQQFPGLHRTQSSKRRHGFAPGDPGGDEPMAPNTSAYASVLRGERPQASNPQTYFQPTTSPTAKMQPQPEEPSTTFIPGFERRSTRYATAGGEKTDLSGARMGRSASVRRPPSIERDSLPRTNPPSPASPPSSRGRHHSASPKLKPDRNRYFASSDSSDVDHVNLPHRPKATSRRRLFAGRPRHKLHNHVTRDHDDADSGENFIAWAIHPDSWLLTESHAHTYKTT
jgi:hypothetical protein